MFYFTNPNDKNVELALCLYYFDFLNSSLHHGMIINTANGSVTHQTEAGNSAFLSVREKNFEDDPRWKTKQGNCGTFVYQHQYGESAPTEYS